MPYGFMGSASEKYLRNVDDALTKNNNTYDRNAPDEEGLLKSPYPPEEAFFGGYAVGVGNQSNIVVDQDAYSEILRRIQAADTNAIEDLNKISTEIDNLCSTDYIIPKTLHRYSDVLIRTKNTFKEFRSLTEDVEIRTRNYVQEILDV